MTTPEQFGAHVRLGGYVRGNTLANDRARVAYDIEQGDTVLTAAACAYSALSRKVKSSRPVQMTMEDWQRVGEEVAGLESIIGAEEGAIYQLAGAYESLTYQAYQWFLRNRTTVTIGENIYLAHEPRRGQKGLYATRTPFGMHDLTCLRRHSRKDVLPTALAIVPRLMRGIKEADKAQSLSGFEVIAYAGERIQTFGADILKLTESSPEALLNLDRFQ